MGSRNNRPIRPQLKRVHSIENNNLMSFLMIGNNAFGKGLRKAYQNVRPQSCNS